MKTSTNPQIVTDRKLYSPRKFTARTRQRFTLDRTVELQRGLGRDPSYAEKILVARIVSNEWDLRRLDQRLDHGEELSGHASRLRLALENRLRLDLRELGLRPAAARAPSLSELMREATEARQRGEAA